jgi:hypothetical protein
MTRLMTCDDVKFASLKEQALLYGDIPDDDPIDYHDVRVGQGIPEELADAIESMVTSAEQAGMSRDGVQSLVTECKDNFRIKLGADPPANVNPLVIKLRDGAEPVQMSDCKYALPQLKFMRDKDTRARRAGLDVQEHWSRVGESSAHPSEARARPVSHDCQYACIERVDEADFMVYV